MMDHILTGTPLVVILVLMVALLVVGTGRGLGELAGLLLKKLLGKGDVNINIDGGEMAGKKNPSSCATCTVTDPSTCPLHQSEHERSIRNEDGIEKLWTNYGELRKEMVAGFKEVQISINTTQRVLINNQQKILDAVGKRPRKDHGDGGGFEP